MLTRSTPCCRGKSLVGALRGGLRRSPIRAGMPGGEAFDRTLAERRHRQWVPIASATDCRACQPEVARLFH